MQKKTSLDTNFQPIFDYIDETCATKTELAEVKEAISHLPTKDEFFDKMDQVLGEVQAMRQEFATHQYQHQEIDRKFLTLGVN